ncbi:MAG: hypothetical protein DME65_15130 [Verrucomicrobia bacterium]|nr:MAG: hypothetical protein DME65_15130 [Verrucomicrobiota bacterium]
MNNNCCNEGLAPAELARRQPKRSPYNSSETLFTALDVYYDDVPHSAGLNMAVDEALLQYATHPVIRFYRWRFPALSIGYFGRFADVATYQIERDLVRRWTGGGIVFHGEDLTYSIVIPANNAAFFVTSISVYEEIHRALCAALAETGQYAVVAHSDDPARLNASVGARRAALSDAGYNCFTTPVRADLLINGRKVAGAAQRRQHPGDRHWERFGRTICAGFIGELQGA